MRVFSIVFVVGFLSYLALYISNHNMGILNPKGVIAVAEKNLIVTSVLLMMIVIVPVFVMLFTFAWRYRASNTKAKYTPEWHNNTALEITWWAIPICIIVILGTITWKSTHELDPFKPLDSSVKPLTIEVVALDWKWLFIYPELNIATVNLLVVPNNTPLNFRITADAPMNAFWIPQLGTQIYAMPGMDSKLHLMAHEEGIYKGVSSNFSGDGFAGMKFDTHVLSSNDFTAWQAIVKTNPSILTLEDYKNLSKQSKNNAVVYYSFVEPRLFDSIIMKFMSPGGIRSLGTSTKMMDHREMMEGMNH